MTVKYNGFVSRMGHAQVVTSFDEEVQEYCEIKCLVESDDDSIPLEGCVNMCLDDMGF